MLLVANLVPGDMDFLLRSSAIRLPVFISSYSLAMSISYVKKKLIMRNYLDVKVAMPASNQPFFLLII